MNKIPPYHFLALVFFCVTRFVFPAEPAKSPDQLVQNLLKAAQNGDIDAFLSALTEETRKAVDESIRNEDSFRKALQEFHKALSERFGNGEQMLVDHPVDLKAAIQRLESAEVMSQKLRRDGSMELRVKTSMKTPEGKSLSREDTLIVRKERGEWKLGLGFAPDGKIAGERIALAERITKEVRDGKYKDRLSAMVALANAWSAKQSSAK